MTERMRIPSVDIIRGAVMVLMALDHVRVYAGVPAGGPDPAVFFTRWVTHFCAPVFVFLAGTSACLSVEDRQSCLSGQAGLPVLHRRRRLAKFLLVRGLWLVLLELTVIRFAWTFNFDYAGMTMAGVIWVIGWSMVVLAGLVFLPAGAIAVFGVAIVVGHNALASLVPEAPSWIVQVLYAGWAFPVGPLNVVVLYTLIPWVGVMAAGYAFGAVVTRRRVCFALGVACIALFSVLRATGVYGDPRPWQGGALQFLNTAKYPASLQFLLMTLGPMFLALPLLHRARWLEVFGKVPFFYYVLHIPLIHLVAVLISLVRTPESTGWLFANHPMLPPEVPPGYRWSLGLLYLVTALVVLALYFPCRWYAREKSERPRPWMRFV